MGVEVMRKYSAIYWLLSQHFILIGSHWLILKPSSPKREGKKTFSLIDYRVQGMPGEFMMSFAPTEIIHDVLTASWAPMGPIPWFWIWNLMWFEHLWNLDADPGQHQCLHPHSKHTFSHPVLQVHLPRTSSQEQRKNSAKWRWNTITHACCLNSVFLVL